MGTVTVRVIPRAGSASVSVGDDGRTAVRVRAAPDEGRATMEAVATLARALGVAPSRITLRAGARSRTKVFAVEGVDDDEISVLLRATKDH